MPIKDPIKRKEYEKQYRKKNIEKVREWRNNWNKENPIKKREMDREQRRKHPWKKHYDHAKQRCTNPNHQRYSSYGAKGINFNLTLNEVKELYIRDKADTMKYPSIDRKNTYGDYIFANCRFIEFEDNNKRPKRKKFGRDLYKKVKNHKDNDGHYVFSNCRFIELKKNISKRNLENPNIKTILQYDLEGIFIREWKSITEASKFYKCHISTISNNLLRKNKTACGFKWRYKK